VNLPKFENKGRLQIELPKKEVVVFS